MSGQRGKLIIYSDIYALGCFVPDFQNYKNQVFLGLSVQEENFCVYPVCLHCSEKHGEAGRQAGRQTGCLGNYIYGNMYSTIKIRKSCSCNRQYIQVDS